MYGRDFVVGGRYRYQEWVAIIDNVTPRGDGYLKITLHYVNVPAAYRTIDGISGPRHMTLGPNDDIPTWESDEIVIDELPDIADVIGGNE